MIILNTKRIQKFTFAFRKIDETERERAEKNLI